VRGEADVTIGVVPPPPGSVGRTKFGTMPKLFGRLPDDASGEFNSTTSTVQ
jgi:hypothetical protein